MELNAEQQGEPMRGPRDTTKTDPLILLAESMGPGGSDALITNMEARGQREVINSTAIPTDLNGCTEEDLTALGFKLREVHVDDPLFREVTLPDGWSKWCPYEDGWTQESSERDGPNLVRRFKQVVTADGRRVFDHAAGEWKWTGLVRERTIAPDGSVVSEREYRT